MAGHTRRRPIWLSQALAVAAALLAGSPGWCAPKLEAMIGWDGQLRAGRWSPVFVTIDNSGQPVKGTLRVRPADARAGRAQSATTLRPVDLPAPSRQRHVVYVRADPTYPPLAVELLEGRRTIARAAYVQPSHPGFGIRDDDRLFVVIGRETGSLGFLAAPSGHPGGTRLAYPEPDFLPDRPQGYDAVDVLVLGDVPARIPRTALDAMRDWVGMGGTLVISGGANTTRLRTPALEALLPVHITGSRALSGLPALSRAYGHALPPGGLAVAEGVPLPGARVLLSQDGLPLAVSRRLGAGWVIFLAFDFEAFPVKGWAGQEAMWEDLLASARAPTPPIPGDRFAREATIIGQAQVPSFWLVGIFLIGYPLVLIPINYLVLKRRRRLEWAWFTVPLIVVVFSLAAYGAGYAMKGGLLLLNRAAVVEGWAGTGQGRGILAAGLFSPRRGRYRLSTSGAPIAPVGPEDRRGSAIRRAVATQGDDGTTLTADIDMWALGVFRADVPVYLGGGIEAHLEYAGGKVRGKIANRTPYDLSQCFLLLGDRQQPVGTLPQGKTISVDLAAKTDVALLPVHERPYYGGIPHGYYGRHVGATTNRERKQARLYDLLDLAPNPRGRRQPSDLLLVGWNDEPLSPLKLDRRPDRESDLNCFVIHLPYRWVPIGGRVVIPPGAARGIRLPEVSSASQYRDDGGVPHFSEGYVVYAFHLPQAARDLRLDGVEVAYSLTGSGRAHLSVYDWSRGGWTPLASGPSQGRGPAFQLQGSKRLPAGPHVARGVVQVRVGHRLDGGGGEVHISRLAVGFSGRPR